MNPRKGITVTIHKTARKITSVRSTRTRLAAVSVIAVAGLGLAACSPSNENDSEQPAASSSQESGAEKDESTAAMGSEDVTFDDAYVTAMPAEKKMTSVFGKLVNNTDKEIHIVSASGSLDVKYELHEVVDGVMQENPDGFRIPANGELELKPGGDHIMLMDVKKEIAAGDDVELSLKDEEGKEYSLGEVPVRVQQSSHEHYGHGAMNHGDMDHGDMKHGDMKHGDMKHGEMEHGDTYKTN